MADKNFNHIPVMLEECIEFLNIKPDGIYIDGTMRRSWAQLSYSKEII